MSWSSGYYNPLQSYQYSPVKPKTAPAQSQDPYGLAEKGLDYVPVTATNPYGVDWNKPGYSGWFYEHRNDPIPGAEVQSYTPQEQVPAPAPAPKPKYDSAAGGGGGGGYGGYGSGAAFQGMEMGGAIPEWKAPEYLPPGGGYTPGSYNPGGGYTPGEYSPGGGKYTPGAAYVAPTYKGPGAYVAPTWNAPVYDHKKENAYAQKFAQPQMAELRRAVRQAITRSGISGNPILSKYAMGGAMEQFGEGTGKVMGEAGKYGLAAYGQEYGRGLDAAKMAYGVEANQSMTNYNQQTDEAKINYGSQQDQARQDYSRGQDIAARDYQERQNAYNMNYNAQESAKQREYQNQQEAYKMNYQTQEGAKQRAYQEKQNAYNAQYQAQLQGDMYKFQNQLKNYYGSGSNGGQSSFNMNDYMQREKEARDRKYGTIQY
jgi:hypothetical protein